MHKHLEAGQVILHVAFLSFNLQLAAGKNTNKLLISVCIGKLILEAYQLSPWSPSPTL